MLTLPLLMTLVTQPDEGSGCGHVRATSINEGVGWSHYVEITNVCDVPIECLVATDVDPWPEYFVVVPSRDTERVRTRFGSAFAVYTPIVSCTIDDG